MWVSREMDEKKNVKICFAASSGGHYEQLMMLKPLMEKYDSFVITEKTDYSAEAKGEKTYYMKQVNRREKDFIWRMIQNAWKSIGIYRKEKPDVVICTGVLAMIPIDFITVQHQVGCESVMLVKKDVLVLNGQKLVQGMQVHEQLMLQIMPQRIAAHHLLRLFVQLAIDKNQWLIKIERK